MTARAKPILMLLFATTLDLGRLALAQLSIDNAAREGAFQASKVPADIDNTQPCPADASSNTIVCRVLLEAKSSGVTIAPADISLTCSVSGCPTGLGNVVRMELSSAFNGHRLCENTVGLLEEEGLTYWWQSGAVDKSEWINQIRTTSTIGSDYYIQESIHPDYWGQLGLRSCLRQAYNGGAPHGGTCNILTTGLDSLGEPQMYLH